MKAAIRRLAVRLRAMLLAPVLGRVDVAEERLDGRLTFLSRRLDEIEAMVQSAQDRTDTVSERSLGLAESQARISRRVDEIERLLGSPAGDR